MKKKGLTTLAGLTLLLASVLSAQVCIASDSTGRIINGTESVKGDWPFMVALIDKSKPDTYEGQFCGASFLGGRYVLTAAHCISKYVTAYTSQPDFNIYVSIGLHNLSNVDTEGQKAEIRHIYMHEDYPTTTPQNDIAIIELDKEVTATNVALATDALTNSLTAGDLMTVMGWGNQSTTGNDFPHTLYQVDVPYVDRSTCQNLGGSYASVNDGNICAGYAEGGKDSCQGDSGGPLVFSDNGTYKQVGVVSYGSGCAQPDAYGVYANVAYYQNWIAAKTSGISYEQRINTISTEQTVQFDVPLTNYGTESFDVKNFELPTGVTVVDNGCQATLNQGGSCVVKVNVDRKAAGFLPSQAGKEVSFKIITDHSKAPELGIVAHFHLNYNEVPENSSNQSGTTSSSSSGGASFGLLFLMMFGFVFRRR